MTEVDLAIVLDHVDANCGVRIRYFNLLNQCAKRGIRTAVLADAQSVLPSDTSRVWQKVKVPDEVAGLTVRRRPFISLYDNNSCDELIIDAIREAQGVPDDRLLQLDAWTVSKEWITSTVAQVQKFISQLQTERTIIATQSFLGFAATQVRLQGLVVGMFHTDYGMFYAARLLRENIGHTAFTRLSDAINYRITSLFIPQVTRAFVSSPTLSGRFVSDLAPAYEFPGGVDTDVFVPAKRVVKRKIRVLFVGRLSEEKGLCLLAQIYELGWNFEWVVVGEGALSGRLQKLMPMANFRGRLTQAEVAAEMSSADLLLFPCPHDTFGLVALEAMSCGLPVVAAEGCGIASLLVDSGAGIVTQANAFELYSALETLAASPERRRDMGERGREVAEGRTWGKVCDLFLAQLGFDTEV